MLDQRFQDSYLNPIPGFYSSGDGGFIDDDGYVFVMGRTDDVINVAGHRLSTGEMEEIVAAHPAVAECAVFGVQDELKGELPLAMVVLKDGFVGDEDALKAELVAAVRQQIGALACFNQSLIVERLPKTRSGKILRGMILRVYSGQPAGDLTSVENPDALDAIVAIRPRLIVAARIARCARDNAALIKDLMTSVSCSFPIAINRITARHSCDGAPLVDITRPWSGAGDGADLFLDLSAGIRCC